MVSTLRLSPPTTVEETPLAGFDETSEVTAPFKGIPGHGVVGSSSNFPPALPLVLISIGSAAFAVNTIAQDGETNWFEGVLLLGVYVILAMAFYFVGPGR